MTGNPWHQRGPGTRQKPAQDDPGLGSSPLPRQRPTPDPQVGKSLKTFNSFRVGLLYQRALIRTHVSISAVRWT